MIHPVPVINRANNTRQTWLWPNHHKPGALADRSTRFRAGLSEGIEGAGCGEKRAAKQMGPALLPTPLLPARGRFGCAGIGTNPCACMSLNALGARRLIRVQLRSSISILSDGHVCAPLCFAVRRRRSHRHPTRLRDYLPWSGSKPFP